MNRKIPKKIYDNIAFLKRFISIFFYNSEEYGSLLAGGTVAPESLKIYPVEKDKLVLVKL